MLRGIACPVLAPHPGVDATTPDRETGEREPIPHTRLHSFLASQARPCPSCPFPHSKQEIFSPSSTPSPSPPPSPFVVSIPSTPILPTTGLSLVPSNPRLWYSAAGRRAYRCNRSLVRSLSTSTCPLVARLTPLTYICHLLPGNVAICLLRC